MLSEWAAEEGCGVASGNKALNCLFQMNSELQNTSSNIWKVDPPMGEQIICWSAQGI